jgi:hypothetical protein
MEDIDLSDKEQANVYKAHSANPKLCKTSKHSKMKRNTKKQRHDAISGKELGEKLTQNNTQKTVRTQKPIILSHKNIQLLNREQITRQTSLSPSELDELLQNSLKLLSQSLRMLNQLPKESESEL